LVRNVAIFFQRDVDVLFFLSMTDVAILFFLSVTDVAVVCFFQHDGRCGRVTDVAVVSSVTDVAVFLNCGNVRHAGKKNSLMSVTHDWSWLRRRGTQTKGGGGGEGLSQK
jgi:hypothetical protein